MAIKESDQPSSCKRAEKAQRDREYRDKRLVVAAQLMAPDVNITYKSALEWADRLIQANEEMAVPE